MDNAQELQVPVVTADGFAIQELRETNIALGLPEDHDGDLDIEEVTKNFNEDIRNIDIRNIDAMNARLIAELDISIAKCTDPLELDKLRNFRLKMIPIATSELATPANLQLAKKYARQTKYREIVYKRVFYRLESGKKYTFPNPKSLSAIRSHLVSEVHSKNRMFLALEGAMFSFMDTTPTQRYGTRMPKLMIEIKKAIKSPAEHQVLISQLNALSVAVLES
jgi:hypothetical protein